MKRLLLIAALAFGGATAAPIADPAAAQTVTRTTTVVRAPAGVRRNRVVTRRTVVRSPRYNNVRRGYGRRQVCSTRFRNGRRVRVCRYR